VRFKQTYQKRYLLNKIFWIFTVVESLFFQITFLTWMLSLWKVYKFGVSAKIRILWNLYWPSSWKKFSSHLVSFWPLKKPKFSFMSKTAENLFFNFYADQIFILNIYIAKDLKNHTSFRRAISKFKNCWLAVQILDLLCLTKSFKNLVTILLFCCKFGFCNSFYRRYTQTTGTIALPYGVQAIVS
jgi:hypothetical protein